MAKLTKKQRRMRDIVKRFKKFVRTYDKQHGYEDFEDDTFIHDMLYGIGIALEPEKNQFAQGYYRWLTWVADMISGKFDGNVTIEKVE